MVGPLDFPMNVIISLPISVKKASWDFDGNYTESVDQFGENIAILTMLSLPMHEQRCFSIYLGLL